MNQLKSRHLTKLSESLGRREVLKTLESEMVAIPPKTNPFKLDLVILLNILTADISTFCAPTW